MLIGPCDCTTQQTMYKTYFNNNLIFKIYKKNKKTRFNNNFIFKVYKKIYNKCFSWYMVYSLFSGHGNQVNKTFTF